MMELLYSRLTKDEVYSKDSRINQAFCRSEKNEGNELSKTLIKYVSSKSYFRIVLSFFVH